MGGAELGRIAAWEQQGIGVVSHHRIHVLRLIDSTALVEGSRAQAVEWRKDLAPSGIGVMVSQGSGDPAAALQDPIHLSALLDPPSHPRLERLVEGLSDRHPHVRHGSEGVDVDESWLTRSDEGDDPCHMLVDLRPGREDEVLIVRCGTVIIWDVQAAPARFVLTARGIFFGGEILIVDGWLDGGGGEP